MENAGSSDLPEYHLNAGDYVSGPDDYPDTVDVTDIRPIEVMYVEYPGASDNAGDYMTGPFDYEHTSMEPESAPAKPMMEATENGGVAFHSQDAVVLLAKGLERAAETHRGDPYADAVYTVLQHKVVQHMRQYDEAAASGGAADIPELRFDPDESLPAPELERVLEKAIFTGVYGTTDAEADAVGLVSPEAELARNMRNEYEVSKLTPELKAFYGIDGPNPDPERLEAAMYDQRQRAQAARERHEQ